MDIPTVSGGSQDRIAIEGINKLAVSAGLDIAGGSVLRTSSRLCLGVEHGDYNGTELFGIGTDRFIWLAYKPNKSTKIRLLSDNFPDENIIEFEYVRVPPPGTVKDSWARFPFGVEYILRQNGFKLAKGFDAVLYGNIPGGGMSRSASLTLNLILTMFDVNGISENDGFRIVDLAQAVENIYIGSPCGQLDQIMILFAKEGTGTHYNPSERKISHIPFGSNAEDFRIACLDTGTRREGLEKSTYKIRRDECEELVSICRRSGFDISVLADVKEQAVYDAIIAKFSNTYPN